MKSKRLPTQDYIGPQIKTLSILIEKKMNAQLVANGINLTGNQISILAFLYDHQKTVNQKEIELKFKISHPTVRGIIRRLVALNVVETTTSDQDRRQILLMLSTQGQKFMKENLKIIQDPAKKMESRLRDNIRESDYEIFQQVLHQMINNLQ